MVFEIFLDILFALKRSLRSFASGLRITLTIIRKATLFAFSFYILCSQTIILPRVRDPCPSSVFERFTDNTMVICPTVRRFVN